MYPTEHQRAQTLELRSFAFDHLSAIAAVLDGAGVIVDTNEAWRLFAHLNGGSIQSTGLGVSYLDVCDRAAASGANGAAAAAAGLRRILDGECDRFDLEYPCASPAEDRWFLLQAASAPVADGTGVVLFHVDMTARKLLEDCLAVRAEHDDLTGLANRGVAVRYVTEQLAAARVSGAQVRVLFFDLDGLKSVNDTHGHHAGDELLVQVAARARRALREGDLLCRFGGDEFFLACPGLDQVGATALAARLRDVMSQPFQVGAAEVSIGASVGVASSDADSTVDSLLRMADSEMYIDKAREARHRMRVAPR
jgi:diguanylate cyclase (GGDEF)-like protein